MKLYGITTAHNVEGLIPYVMPYVCRLGYDKFIVYNDQSTDRTVELLKQYDFVEIRNFPTNNEENVSKRDFLLKTRTKLILNFYSKLSREAYSSKEICFMTVTDFDEVIFMANHTTNFKAQLQWLYNTQQYNCYDGRIINLLPPNINDNLLDKVSKYKLVHMIPGIRGKLWPFEGKKPVLFCVNDMSEYFLVQGNHHARFKPFNNKTLKNLDELGCIYTFHLKYINKETFLKQQNDYNSDTKMAGYIDQCGQDIYDNSMYGASFPLDIYFCLKQFNATPSKYEGIYNIVTNERV